AGLPRDRYAPAPRAVSGAAPEAARGVMRLLLAATLLSAVATFVGRLATSLAMNGLGFDVGAIGGALAVGALATLPLLPLVGALSDRLGRRRFLAAAYVLGGLGTLALAFASALWQFWLASALISLAVAASSTVISALAADLLPPGALSAALPRIMAAGWAAAVIGFAGGGYLLERLGLLAVALLAVALAAAAAGLLARLPLPAPAPGRAGPPAAPLRQSKQEARP
ncbi:MAG TPA: MFS transporter, partial [Chloroflexaceae bacterium]|nr:MFS transporter [Chloroflexaceae bacterium]